jgi:PST family polysaccharide transporter
MDPATLPPPGDPLADVEPSSAKPSAQGISTGAMVAAGTFWSLAQTLLTKALMFAGQLMLAWILAPGDFGKIGMAYTVTTLVALLINPGIDVILVRRGRRFELWSTPAFFFSLAMSGLGALVILAISPLVSAIYGEPQLVGLLSVLALSTPLGALLLVPTAKLRSQMRFKALAAVNLLQTTLQMTLTVAFAAAGLGVYSFVLPMPIVYLAISIALWSIARPPVRIHAPFRHWKYLLGDSGYIFGMRALTTAVAQGDYVVLGVLYGASVVGPYYFAFGMAVQAIRLTAGSLQLVLMAGLTQLTEFSQQQTRAALRATRALAMLGMPLCMVQAAIASPLLRALYGDKWVEAIPLMQLISVGMAFDVASWPSTSLLQSQGRFRYLFYWALTFAPILMAGIIVGAWRAGSFGVAVAVCAFYTCCSPLLGISVFRSLNVRRREIASVYLRPTLAGVLAAGSSLAASHLASSAGLALWLQCAVGVAAGLISAAVAARLLMPETWQDVACRLSPLLLRLRLSLPLMKKSL